MRAWAYQEAINHQGHRQTLGSGRCRQGWSLGHLHPSRIEQQAGDLAGAGAMVAFKNFSGDHLHYSLWWLMALPVDSIAQANDVGWRHQKTKSLSTLLQSTSIAG
jgi:hypothetical protein